MDWSDPNKPRKGIKIIRRENVLKVYDYLTYRLGLSQGILTSVYLITCEYIQSGMFSVYLLL